MATRKPTHAIRDDNPDHVISQMTNELQREKGSSKSTNSVIELAISFIKDRNLVIVSSIVPRFDTLNNKANEVNNRLVAMEISLFFLTVKV